LTTIEYNEFGNPSKKLEDFISVGLISPVDSAATNASPKVMVITRTGLNDSQVYPYESIKWIRRLRSHDKKGDAPKIAFAEPNQGHFVDPDKDLVQHIQDMSLLDSWMDGTLVR
jgi:protease II